MRKPFIICMLMCLGFMACIEEFTPVIPGSNNSYVVEANMLEGKGGAKVILSRSIEFGRSTTDPINGATVVIEDDQGNSEQLQMTGPGIYISDTSRFTGIPGRSYQLLIDMPNGEKLESTWQLMPESARLDEPRQKWEEQEDELGLTEGLGFYLDVFANSNTAQHFRWEFEEDWEFRVPFPAAGLWNTQTNLPEFYPNRFRPQICYAHRSSTNILIGSTLGLTTDRIADYPLHFVSIRGNELRIRYSILIRQFSISPETHEFWRRLREVTEEPGSLFDPIPTEIEGNISILNNEDEQVIGYFSADGYQEKIIFIDRRDLPQVPIRTGFESCVFDTVDRFEVNTEIISGKVFVDEVFSVFGSLIGFGMTDPECADCRLNGNIDKPDFWD
ncbi:MAG: DUF4249 domain-containing protein [Bacteroidota bacterium]